MVVVGRTVVVVELVTVLAGVVMVLNSVVVGAVGTGAFFKLGMHNYILKNAHQGTSLD